MSNRSGNRKYKPGEDQGKTVEKWKKLGKKNLVLKCNELYVPETGKMEELVQMIYGHYQEHFAQEIGRDFSEFSDVGGYWW